MKTLLTAILACVLLTSCASPRPWTKQEKIAAGFFIAGHIADAYTTEKALDQPNTYETNEFLGEHPSDTKVMIYFPLTGFLTLGVLHIWPNLRQPLLFGLGALRIRSATRNSKHY